MKKRKLKNETKPTFDSYDYFKKISVGECLPLLDKPCHDCAIITGFYTPIADELLKEDEVLQDEVLKRWYCHNHFDKACRGVRNYITNMKKKERSY